MSIYNIYYYRIKEDSETQSVILSLPHSSPERILEILKNLADLLEITTPIPYKIHTDGNSELSDNNPLNEGIFNPVANNVIKKSKHDKLLDYKRYAKLQSLLNGKCRICRNCSKSIEPTDTCYKDKRRDHNKSNSAIPLAFVEYYYFCSKTCYVQFRWSDEKKSSIDQNNQFEIKDVLNKMDETMNDGNTTVSDENQPNDNNSNDMDNLKKESLSNKSPKDADKQIDQQMVTENSSNRTPSTKKKVCFRYYNSKCFPSSTTVKKVTEKEVRDLLFKMDIPLSISSITSAGKQSTNSAVLEDRRRCILCLQVCDGVSDGSSRLLNFDIDKWVHLNCALWSTDVYETISGALMNFQLALQMGLNQYCVSCQQLGATIKCYKTRCGAVYHLPCAIREQCVFYQNKTIHCQIHASRNDKEKELCTLAVQRKVYVERDENRQVAAILHHSDLMNLLRVGSLIFLNVGQLMPHQLEAFHTANYIYPIGYKIVCSKSLFGLILK